MRKRYEGKAERGAFQTIRVLRRLPEGMIAGSTIVDLGCNEGLVAAYLIAQGAARVIGYEPHPTACARAACVMHPPHCVRPLAVMGAMRQVELRVGILDHAAQYFCNATIVPVGRHQSNYVYVPVDATTFLSVLASDRPSGIKLDVEGSEYDMLLRTSVPVCVEWIVMEVHWLKGVGAYLLPFVMDRLHTAGFGMTVWPQGLQVRARTYKTFHPFAVMTVQRGATTSPCHQRWLNVLRQKGRTAFRAGFRPHDPIRAELFQMCYDRKEQTHV